MPTINTTAGTAGQAGSTAAELINVLKTPMLLVPDFDNMLEMYLFEPIPLQGGKTIQRNRMERLGVASSPAQLTEGVAPNPRPVTINSVTATVEEYGDAVYFSSLAVLSAKNDLVREAVKILGLSLKETRDRLLYTVADAATNTFRVNDRANDNAITLGDKLSFEEISEVKGVLRTAGVPFKADGTYHLIVPSAQHQDLAVDNNWLNANQYAYPGEIRRGTVVMILGVSVFETNSNSFAATASTTTGNSSKIRSSFICGREAASVTDLEATQMHMQARGGGSDWTKRRVQMGWTGTFKSFVNNQTFLRRIRASSSDATAV